MKKQAGFTLIELMVGIALGLIVLAGALALFANTLQANATGVKQQRFEQTLQVLAAHMVSEIRRAGYAKPGVALTKQSNGGYYVANGNCVTFSHSTPDSNEQFYGYQLANNLVYYYTSTTTNGNCANLTGWTAVTDLGQIKVTNLLFANFPLVGITLDAEAVGLTVTGGTAVKRSMTVSVRVRNG
jgi:prepilin peptidase dependent protein B